MSGTFGSPGRKPGKPGGSPRARGGSPERPVPPTFQQAADEQDSQLPAWGNRPGADISRPQPQQPIEEQDVEPLHIEPSKRLVALMFDVAAAYLAGVLVAMIPFVNNFMPLQIVVVVGFLCRDCLFGGRGIGKNLMGLRVVDARTGAAPTILQSVQRNIILVAPFVVLQTVPNLLKVIPIEWVNQVVMQIINIVGMLYVAIVLPLESYRAYSREDSLRIGDEIAGTTIIESQMDFSQPIQR